MRALSLFSGAGGGVLGLQRAGFDVVGSVDFDTDACATLITNGVRNVTQADINTFDWSMFTDVDVVLGGPPCQPFSSAGKGGGVTDARDGLPGFVRAVEQTMPQVFVMENVRGLTFKKHAEYLEYVVKCFVNLGYEVDYRVLNAANYGVPQTRQRLFVVGRRDGEQVGWPELTHAKAPTGSQLPWVSMAATIDVSPDMVLHTNRDQRPDGSRQTIPAPAPAPTFTVEAGGQWWFHRPATTLVANFGSNIVAAPGYRKAGDTPRQSAPGSVKVTPAQAATLQDFPSDWRFIGSKTSVFKQIGNACPHRLIAAVVGAQADSLICRVGPEWFAEAVAHAWDDSRGPTTIGAQLGTSKTVDEYARMTCLLTGDGRSGAAVTADGDIVSVFNTGPSGRGGRLVERAIAAGGTHLDCFETFLPDYYRTFGFETYKVEDNWDGPDYPKVHYMRLVTP